MLIMSHAGGAILLFLLASLSIFIAVLTAVNPGADRANKRLVKIANTIGLTENIVAAIVTLTGVIAMFVGSWPLSQLWVWMSLLIMVFYSVTLVYVTKPMHLVVAEGGSEVKSGMQVILHVVYLLLLLVAFALTLLKPI